MPPRRRADFLKSVFPLFLAVLTMSCMTLGLFLFVMIKNDAVNTGTVPQSKILDAPHTSPHQVEQQQLVQMQLQQQEILRQQELLQQTQREQLKLQQQQREFLEEKLRREQAAAASEKAAKETPNRTPVPVTKPVDTSTAAKTVVTVPAVKPAPPKIKGTIVYHNNSNKILSVDGIKYHFVHIPKCGGTSMTAVLREVACHVDPEHHVDCCTNPGFCDWHAHRRCTVIKGCINHFPQRPWIFRGIPSITMVREPISRLISAFHYHGHSPNMDYFQVRPEFKEIKQGKRPKVTFPEYLEMFEYQNIITRMLGADSFPYRAVVVDDVVYTIAIEALDAFTFVGLQEAYEISVELMIRELGLGAASWDKEQGGQWGGGFLSPVKKERDNEGAASRQVAEAKAAIRANGDVMKRASEVNSYDVKLYKLAVKRFCAQIKKYPDLVKSLHSTTKVKCE